MEFMTLENPGGERIQVGFRPFRPEDAEGVIRCIRDEYGEKYHKKHMYDPGYIIRQNREGKLLTFVAQKKDGGIIGTLSIQRNLPLDTSGSIATGIILKKYRGFHMFFPLTAYIAENIRKLEGVSAIYCRLIFYHDITQQLMYRIGLKPCGFVPSLILGSKFHHSYGEERAAKLTLGIMVQKLSKHEAGRLYLPPEHGEIARSIYSSLEVACSIACQGEPPEGKTHMSVAQDELQCTAAIEIHSPGADLGERLARLHEAYPSREQTFNAFLNINDPGAIEAYRTMEGAGYFFTGFKPICSEQEYMLLHRPGQIPVDFDALKLIPPFAELKDYVKACYDRRRPSSRQISMP